jgi:putative tryptophan/tyrosine transport system substrate-binding protein
MNRGALIVLLGGVTMWSIAALAQQPMVPVVGILVLGTPEPTPFLRGIHEGLAELGYAEGRNIRYELRSAEGNANLLRELAAELVRLKVDVIAAFQTPASTAAKQATSEVPIVMGSAGDPVGSGLVPSLARPGGNITGLSSATAEVAGKSMELIREILPNARRVAVLANASDAFTAPFLSEIGRYAGNLGLEMKPVLVQPGQPLDAAFDTMTAARAQVLIVQGSLARKEVVDLATRHRLPIFSSNQILGTLGGIITYAANQEDMHRRAAGYIDRILKGAKPTDLPVQLPTKFELIINLKTAQALGIEISPMLLARADEVIE